MTRAGLDNSPGPKAPLCYRAPVPVSLLGEGSPLTCRPAWILVALLFAPLCLGCNSDLKLEDSDTASTSTSSTSTGTDDSTSTTSDSTSTTGDETTSTSTTGEPEQSCRDALQCIGLCAVMLDLQCFQDCTMGLPPEEGQKALALGLCIGMQCFAGGSCTASDPMSQECLTCVALSLISPKPPGCEDEAAACM